MVEKSQTCTIKFDVKTGETIEVRGVDNQVIEPSKGKPTDVTVEAAMALIGVNVTLKGICEYWYQDAAGRWYCIRYQC